MKNQILKANIAVLSLLFTTTAVAQVSKQGPNLLHTKAAQKAAPSKMNKSLRQIILNSKSASMGGVNGGGGNLLMGKPIEAYTFEFKDSPEFKKYVSPVLAVVKKYLPKVQQDLKNTLERKAWYNVPVTLETLPSDMIGAPFSSDQGALQTINAVWISGPAYNPMQVQDKALLLMHEVMLGLRYQQLNATYVFCKVSNSAVSKPKDCSLIKETPLSPEDYNQVRQASYQLLKLKQITARAVTDVLIKNGFKVGSPDIAEIPVGFKDMNFETFRQVMTSLSQQGQLPNRGSIIWNTLPEPTVRTDVILQMKIQEGATAKDFAVSLSSPDSGFSETFKNFIDLTYVDDTESDNSVYYILSQKSKTPRIGDVAAEIIFQFRGHSLIYVSSYYEMYGFTPALNANSWQSSSVDNEGKPSTQTEIKK